MQIIRCPKCNDIITEEDIVARDDKGFVMFRHRGRYWLVKEEKTETEVINTNDPPTSQCWLTGNRPIYRATDTPKDSNEAV